LRFANVIDGALADDIPRGVALAWSSTDRVANYFTYSDGTNILFQVGIVDTSAAGAFADDDFTFMITDVGCSGIICNIIIFPKNQKTPGQAEAPGQAPRTSN
jgi:hypothetical protein